MNYNELSTVLLIANGSRLAFSEADCSPHPMDIMAIYALYQSRD